MEGYESLFIYLAISILLLPCFLIFFVIKPILKLSKPLSHISWPEDSEFNDQTPMTLDQLLIANRETKLSLCSFKKEREEETRCVVCQCDMEEGDESRELKCRHVFHRGCLDRWVDFGHVVCPLCRVPLLTAGAKAKIRETVRDISDWCFW